MFCLTAMAIPLYCCCLFVISSGDHKQMHCTIPSYLLIITHP